jgi:RNA polymerase-associated protein RTF1
MQLPPPTSGKKKNFDSKMPTNGTDINNLYSLHDFDIDLDVSLPGLYSYLTVDRSFRK